MTEKGRQVKAHLPENKWDIVPGMTIRAMLTREEDTAEGFGVDLDMEEDPVLDSDMAMGTIILEVSLRYLKRQ